MSIRVLDRNKLLSYPQKEKILCATNQPKLQAISPWMMNLSIVAKWCKEHSKLSQLRLFMAVWQKGAL